MTYTPASKHSPSWLLTSQLHRVMLYCLSESDLLSWFLRFSCIVSLLSIFQIPIRPSAHHIHCRAEPASATRPLPSLTPPHTPVLHLSHKLFVTLGLLPVRRRQLLHDPLAWFLEAPQELLASPSEPRLQSFCAPFLVGTSSAQSLYIPSSPSLHGAPAHVPVLICLLIQCSFHRQFSFRHSLFVDLVFGAQSSQTRPCFLTCCRVWNNILPSSPTP